MSPSPPPLPLGKYGEIEKSDSIKKRDGGGGQLTKKDVILKAFLQQIHMLSILMAVVL